MTSLHQTPLHELHARSGAKFTDFAGYEMPVQYAMGVKREHEHTRSACGVFDVSHMGQVVLTGEGCAEALETLVCADIVGLSPGRQRYALFTTQEGGVVDDLMVANQGDALHLVINAARRDIDITLLKTGLPDQVNVEVLSRALIAVQGPKACEVLKALNPETETMVFMDHRALALADIPVWLSRSGYTGEDGFEISVAEADAERLMEHLMAFESVEPIGLGARDSLRLEAGLCLYGNDLDEQTTPIEAGLHWAVGKARRQGGEREGGFPGADVILTQLANRDHLTQRVGLVVSGRAPVRAGSALFDEQDNQVGEISSGTFGPTLGKPIAMAYLPVEMTQNGTRVWADVRGKRHEMTVTAMPFVTPNYAR
ncbi:glycine cleavage system aminomethyltransferase GcvT [Larsenimonas salina]|uniref:glycine cleavage system aminomethyltransferase GcvT n=1 Tax=Larsenimonas salina TaxID=1295565 RepID=UPI0020735CAB|nr:glycine cleavage system aminomethyltransferase GcvT [Larsenimonas salina]MCM5703421.1 glycine cleavage system aminomethyltransferase GcvT [Larsenimonas salina]